MYEACILYKSTFNNKIPTGAIDAVANVLCAINNRTLTTGVI